MTQPITRAPRKTFFEKAHSHGLTTDEQLKAWGHRIRDPLRRAVFLDRLEGYTYKAAGARHGITAERAREYENLIFRAMKYALNNPGTPTTLAHFKETPMTDITPIPTIVVQLSDGGIIEAVCADQRVRVITVDYMINDYRDAVEAPDGDMAEVTSVLMDPDVERTREYLNAAGVE